MNNNIAWKDLPPLVTVGIRATGTWTGLPRGDYYLVIEKIEDKFSPDHLIGKAVAKTIF